MTIKMIIITLLIIYISDTKVMKYKEGGADGWTSSLQKNKKKVLKMYSI